MYICHFDLCIIFLLVNNPDPNLDIARDTDTKIKHLWVYVCVVIWSRKGSTDLQWEMQRVSLRSGVSSEFQEPSLLLPLQVGPLLQSRPGAPKDPQLPALDKWNQSLDSFARTELCAYSVHTAKVICGEKLETGACILCFLTPNLKSQILHIPWAHLLVEFVHSFYVLFFPAGGSLSMLHVI